jgi:predicted AAA+ superfamily ATPase
MDAMPKSILYPRFARDGLEQALRDTPVVLIHGPRQCGKTTLARMVGDAAGYAYITFDDDVQRAAALTDPIGFVADLADKTILDEVQRVPSLFLALKAAVDRERRPGRFILTGSTNVLLVPQLADSLAGRMEILRLHPLAQDEMTGTRSSFLDGLFAATFHHRRFERLGSELAGRITSGGYPAAILRPSPKRRAVWYRDYIETMVQRDVRDSARIGALDAIPRLLQLAAGQTARLVNVAEISSAFQLSRPTIRDYVVLLERLFLLEHLPPWHSNRLSRLIKTPKLHIGDTGLAASLLGMDAPSLAKDRALLGQLLETFIFQELKRQASRHDKPIHFHHFRDKDGVEVDLVLERSLKVAGIEIKASATIGEDDFRGLKKLRDSVGQRFAAGVVLYDGENVVGFGDRLYAIPLRAVWETT